MKNPADMTLYIRIIKINGKRLAGLLGRWTRSSILNRNENNGPIKNGMYDQPTEILNFAQ